MTDATPLASEQITQEDRDRAKAVRSRHLLHMAISGEMDAFDDWAEEASIRAMIEFAASPMPEQNAALVHLKDDASDPYSFSTDMDGDEEGLTITQVRYYHWGDDCVIAIGERNYPNNWDDEAFDAHCNALEAALSATPAPNGVVPLDEPNCTNDDYLRRKALTEMVAMDEQMEAEHPGWMTGEFTPAPSDQDASQEQTA